jgi:hypothetical protein
MYFKKNIFFFLILIILLFSANPIFAGRCSGSSGCSACSTCSSCGHCNSGGSCGVCGGSGFGFGKLLLFGGGAILLFSIFGKNSKK